MLKSIKIKFWFVLTCDVLTTITCFLLTSILANNNKKVYLKTIKDDLFAPHYSFDYFMHDALFNTVIGNITLVLLYISVVMLSIKAFKMILD